MGNPSREIETRKTELNGNSITEKLLNRAYKETYLKGFYQKQRKAKN